MKTQGIEVAMNQACISLRVWELNKASYPVINLEIKVLVNPYLCFERSFRIKTKFERKKLIDKCDNRGKASKYKHIKRIIQLQESKKKKVEQTSFVNFV